MASAARTARRASGERRRTRNPPAGWGWGVAHLSSSGGRPSQAAADGTVPVGTGRSAARDQGYGLWPMPFGPRRLGHPGDAPLASKGHTSPIRGFRPPRRLKTTHVAPAVTLTRSPGRPQAAHRPELPTPWKPRPVPRACRHDPSTVARGHARRSGREEARVLRVPTIGAQRASRRETSSYHQPASRSRSRTLLGSLVAASLLASLIAAPAAAYVPDDRPDPGDGDASRHRLSPSIGTPRSSTTSGS